MFCSQIPAGLLIMPVSLGIRSQNAIIISAMQFNLAAQAYGGVVMRLCQQGQGSVMIAQGCLVGLLGVVNYPQFVENGRLLRKWSESQSILKGIEGNRQIVLLAGGLSEEEVVTGLLMCGQCTDDFW